MYRTISVLGRGPLYKSFARHTKILNLQINESVFNDKRQMVFSNVIRKETSLGVVFCETPCDVENYKILKEFGTPILKVWPESIKKYIIIDDKIILPENPDWEKFIDENL